MKKHLITMLVAGAVSLLMAVSAVASQPAWEISKSKKAVHMGKFNYDVTLTLPAADTKPMSDVVFVMDKSTSGNVKAAKVAAKQMLAELVTKTNASVKVGVIVFNRDVTVNLALTTLTADRLATITDAIDKGANGGSNTQGGLLAAGEMLAADTAVPDSNKFIVFITDGIGYVWGKQGSPMSSAYVHAEGNQVGDATTSSFGQHIQAAKELDATYTEPTFDQVYANDAAQKAAAAYDQPFQATYQGDACIPFSKTGEIISSVERAIYLSAHTYADLASKYHCTTVWYTPYGLSNPEFRLANGFMTWTQTVGKSYCLDKDSEVMVAKAFDDLSNQLIYLLGKGTVTDVVGDSFTLQEDSFRLSVKGEALTATAQKDGSVTFGTANDKGEYPYVISYDKAKKTITWQIHVPVTRENPVALTYSLTLNPQKKPGDYKAYTNEKATLDYVDSNGENPGTEDFEKPEIAYRVTADEVVIDDEKIPHGDLPDVGPKPTKPSETNDNPNTGSAIPATAGIGGLVLALTLFAVRRKK